MDVKKLQQLLTQTENITLEFKRKLYKLDDSDPKIQERQRGELIKDILSLANGNATTVGEKAYLIIGAADKLQADGTRTLFDVEATTLTPRRILQLVNPACTPPLEDIECHTVEIEGKRLLVITIWPTPHLHETTRDLKTSTGTAQSKNTSFTKHIVFIRHNESVAVASDRERETIRKLKRIHFTDTRKPSPMPFGALVGAVSGSWMAAAPDAPSRPATKEYIIARLIAGSVLGSGTGWLIGLLYGNWKEYRYQWHFLSPLGRIFLVATIISLFTIASRGAKLVGGMLRKTSDTV